MKVYATEAIRNLAVIGHGDAGKTQLISSLLYVAGATPAGAKSMKARPRPITRKIQSPQDHTQHRARHSNTRKQKLI